MTNDPLAEVMRTVWPWREQGKTRPQERPTRHWSTLLGLALGWSVAVWLYMRGHYRAALAIACLTTGVSAGLLIPATAGSLRRALSAFAHGVGLCLTWLLIVLFFYLVMTPLRGIQALLGKDPLARRWEPQAQSYWSPHPSNEPAEHLRRQF